VLELVLSIQDKMQYEPLLEKRNQIRLLTIIGTESASTSSLVKCALEHVSLDDNPKYKALSYAWGDLHSTRKILISGVEFQATENIEAALRQFAQQFDTVRLWVDAICINQSWLRIPSRSEIGAMTKIVTG
jgi:hypothetical protein